jgi:spermidine/putrescine transport system permease protein
MTITEIKRRLILIGPGLGWLMLFMLVPCALIIINSFYQRGAYGGIETIFTLENYQRAIDPRYLNIFLQSAKIAGIATGLALLIGYPTAYFIATAPKRYRTTLLILVMLPFWSNFLIRTYAWVVLLDREGLINRALIDIGLIDEPLPLLYNQFAIVVGLLYGYLPFAVMPLYAAISRVGPEVREASLDLGASALGTFFRVVLPLTLGGAATSAVFVFVLSIGNFITPDLLGGGRTIMVGNLIYDQFLSARDWPFGSSLAFILMAITMILLFVQALFVRHAEGREDRTHA